MKIITKVNDSMSRYGTDDQIKKVMNVMKNSGVKLNLLRKYDIEINRYTLVYNVPQMTQENYRSILNKIYVSFTNLFSTHSKDFYYSGDPDTWSTSFIVTDERKQTPIKSGIVVVYLDFYDKTCSVEINFYKPKLK